VIRKENFNIGVMIKAKNRVALGDYTRRQKLIVDHQNKFKNQRVAEQAATKKNPGGLKQCVFTTSKMKESAQVGGIGDSIQVVVPMSGSKKSVAKQAKTEEAEEVKDEFDPNSLPLEAII
jgi:hypothetical protein